MLPHDLMYALHVVLMYLHNNKHAQNFYVHIMDLVAPNSVLIPYTSHILSIKILVLPGSASACALF